MFFSTPDFKKWSCDITAVKICSHVTSQPAALCSCSLQVSYKDALSLHHPETNTENQKQTQKIGNIIPSEDATCQVLWLKCFRSYRYTTLVWVAPRFFDSAVEVTVEKLRGAYGCWRSRCLTCLLSKSQARMLRSPGDSDNISARRHAKSPQWRYLFSYLLLWVEKPVNKVLLRHVVIIRACCSCSCSWWWSGGGFEALFMLVSLPNSNHTAALTSRANRPL